jgi:hypothetical protein
MTTDARQVTRREFVQRWDGGIEAVWIEVPHGSRMIHGIASTPTVSTNGNSRVMRGCRMPHLPIPLMFGHEGLKHRGIGEVVFVQRSPSEIYVRAALFDNEAADYAWRLIESGEVRAFSVGPGDTKVKSYVQAEVDGVKFIEGWWLGEVSICRRGANPDCVFEIFKSMLPTC